jgi:hypothetical protein
MFSARFAFTTMSASAGDVLSLPRTFDSCLDADSATISVMTEVVSPLNRVLDLNSAFIGSPPVLTIGPMLKWARIATVKPDISR